MNKKLAMIEIIEIFNGFNKLGDYLGIKDNEKMFLDLSLNTEVRKKYNILAKKMLEFKKADIVKRREMLGLKITIKN